jgi:hypothetical protein
MAQSAYAPVKLSDLLALVGAVVQLRPVTRGQGGYFTATFDRSVCYRGRLGMIFVGGSATPSFVLHSFEVLSNGSFEGKRLGQTYFLGESDQAILAADIRVLEPF